MFNRDSQQAARQALAPELLAQLPDIPALPESDLNRLRYGLHSVAPGFVDLQPLKGQLESFQDFCTREDQLLREHTLDVTITTYKNIEQVIMQVLGYNYTYNGVSTSA